MWWDESEWYENPGMRECLVCDLAKLVPDWTLLETAMTSEASDLETDPPHTKFDPRVKWPAM